MCEPSADYGMRGFGQLPTKQVTSVHARWCHLNKPVAPARTRYLVRAEQYHAHQVIEMLWMPRNCGFDFALITKKTSCGFQILSLIHCCADFRFVISTHTHCLVLTGYMKCNVCTPYAIYM